MADFLSFQGWNHDRGLMSSHRASSHVRSFSSTPYTTTPSKSVSKSSSTSALSRLAMAGSLQPFPEAQPNTDLPSDHSDPDLLQTIPDPRSQPLSPRTPSASPPRHPDLDSEVATLSNKLINAINHQTTLDDSLAAARHDLGVAFERIRQLEGEAETHAGLIASGQLLKRSEVDKDISTAREKLAEEQRRRLTAEADKKDIEKELETLTTALFEEANSMVAVARKETDASERRNDQLKCQLADMELLLASHQEQLMELKSVMQHMSLDRDETETSTNISTAPSTPALTSPEQLGRVFEALNLSPVGQGTGEIPPSYPTSFTHLLQPVLRKDLAAYDDFTALLRSSRRNPPSSRVSSGSYGGPATAGLANLNHTPTHPLSQLPSNGSTSSISTVGTMSSSPATPSTPASAISTGSARDSLHSLTPLKETRFYKRTLVEDIEPTLRLDSAPGLSWLARRTVLNAMSEGSLIVEPMPPMPAVYVPPCSLCNEARRGEAHARRHRFRTNQNDSAQRYALCDYCLGRVRAACDFLGFLRMLKDGHWRTEGAEGDKGAWEECARLRERMFWARLGGGVVPAFLATRDSPRSSSTEDRPSTGADRINRTSAVEPNQALGSVPKRKEDDVFHSNQKRVSIGKTTICTEELSTNANAADGSDKAPSAKLAPALSDDLPCSDETTSKDEDLDDLSKSDATSIRSGFSGTRGEQRLSITIPGAFE